MPNLGKWVENLVSATQRLLGRNTSGSGPTEELTLTQVLDWLSGTQGAVPYRGASNWAALAPGTAGQVLKSGGSGADPSWSGRYIHICFSGAGGDRVWTNMTNAARASAQELFNLTIARVRANLAGCTQFRFSVNVVTQAASSARLALQYSTDGSSWSFAEDTTTNADLDITTTGFKTSSFVNLVSGAKADDLYLRIVGWGSNGTADPVFGTINVEVK